MAVDENFRVSNALNTVLLTIECLDPEKFRIGIRYTYCEDTMSSNNLFNEDELSGIGGNIL